MKPNAPNTFLFGIALCLASPWYVEEVNLLDTPDSSSKELHIYVNFTRGHEFILHDGRLCKCYDTVDKVWQHLNFFQHQCFLHCRVPRIKLIYGNVVLVSVSWARIGSGFTILFEAFCITLIQSEMQVSEVSALLGITAPRIWRIFDYWLSQATADEDLSEVSHLGIDETSSKKGHKYVTVFVDMDNRNVIDVYACKDSNTITNFVEYLESRGGDRNRIENVCINMSPAFISGTLF